jgi:CDP-diacylglycerol--serine O-phosphatidyltransferase
MKWIGFYNYTVVLTYLSLVSSVIGIKLAYDGHVGAAVLCLVLSGVCDMFDGVVARTKKNRTQDEKNFGIQLDSLCDVICFGLFPSVILYFSGVDNILGIAALIFYVLCAVIRLAFFNVLETKRQMSEGGCAKEYRGLPVTSSAMILPFFFLLGYVIPDEIMNAVYHVLPLLVGTLFIADFRVPKVDIGALLHRHREHSEQEGR